MEIEEVKKQKKGKKREKHKFNYHDDFEEGEVLKIYPSLSDESETWIVGEKDRKTVTVSEPIQYGNGFNAYIVFTVNIQGRDGSHLSVQRRYSDFDWLHQRLQQEYKHVLIPIIPEKSLMNRFKPEFLVSRCKALQKFLICVFNHKELRLSESLKVFLADSDEEFQRARNRLQGNQSLLNPQLLSLLGKSVSNVVPFNNVDTEVDPWFESMKQYLEDSEKYLLLTQKALNDVMRKEVEEIGTTKQFADAAFEFGNYDEISDVVLAKQYKRFSEVLMNIASAHEEVIETEQLLDETIQDYINLTPAVRVLCNNRKLLLSTYFQYRDRGTAIMAKLVNTDGDGRVALEQELTMVEERTSTAGSDFRAFSRKSKVELKSHFHRKTELRTALNQFVLINLQQEQKIAKLWQSLLDSLEEENAKDNNDTN